MTSRHVETLEYDDFTWSHVNKIDADAMAQLREQHELHQLDVKEVLPPNQRSKVVVRNHYVFWILHYPMYNRTTGRIVSGELYFFVGRNFLITISPTGLSPVQHLFEKTKKEKVCLACTSPSQLLLFIINEMMVSLFPMLVHVNNDIEDVETEIFSVDRRHRKNAFEILRIKTNIVNFRRAVQPYKALIEKFVGLGKTYVDKAVIAENQHVRETTIEIWQMIESLQDTIDALHETHESLINNRTNEIMRTLTIFSVIVFPLTLLAALFGMNTINTPIVGEPFDFWTIVIIMTLGAFGMLGYFKARKWL